MVVKPGSLVSLSFEADLSQAILHPAVFQQTCSLAVTLSPSQTPQGPEAMEQGEPVLYLGSLDDANGKLFMSRNRGSLTSPSGKLFIDHNKVLCT